MDFYLQIINLLGYYHEYDRLDQIIQFMNKDKIPFDGRMWMMIDWLICSYSALIDAFEDTQLVIDVYNDAKKNVYFIPVI